jgi:hypothetical protein
MAADENEPLYLIVDRLACLIRMARQAEPGSNDQKRLLGHAAEMLLRTQDHPDLTE